MRDIKIELIEAQRLMNMAANLMEQLVADIKQLALSVDDMDEDWDINLARHCTMNYDLEQMFLALRDLHQGFHMLYREQKILNNPRMSN